MLKFASGLSRARQRAGLEACATSLPAYLVSAQTVGQFVYVIRKRISIPSDQAIFIFVNNTLPPTAALMSTVYEQNRDEDGFMYFMYSGENTFGEGALPVPADVLSDACARSAHLLGD